MKRPTFALAITLAVALMIGVRAARGSVNAPGDYISRLEELSTGLRAFQAVFAVVEEQIPPPANFIDAELRHELDRVQEQARSRPEAERVSWRAVQRRMWIRHAQEKRLGRARSYQANLSVNGGKICWKEPERIVSYNGKEMFVVTNPSPPKVQPGSIPVTTWVGITPGFDPVQAQIIPFYGALHPVMPMFSIDDLRKGMAAERNGWWKVHCLHRYGRARAGLVHFGGKGWVEGFRVFLGDQNTDKTHLLEHWRFTDWRSCGNCEFPARIEADYFSPAPMGAKPPFRTARTRHIVLTLVSFSSTTPPGSTFDVQPPKAGAHVQDDRYSPGLSYRYPWLKSKASFNELSDYYYKHPQERSESSGARALELEKTSSRWRIALLLIALGALQFLRIRSRAFPTGRGSESDAGADHS